MKIVVMFILFFICSCSRSSVDKLSQIPTEDRVRIEKLFSFLIWDETFAYVLFGDKPMSVSTQDKTAPAYYLEKYQYPRYELESLWKTWEKYAHLFPMSEFIFIIENHEKWFNINLLNKSNCLAVIEKNLDLFQKKTGYKLNALEMFNYIVKNSGNDIYKNSLNKSQGLYGILLGYGAENSLGFENYFSANSEECILPLDTGRLMENEGASLPTIPCFASFSDAVTQKIIEGYKHQRQEILKIYSNEDFLETTINRLTTKKPLFSICSPIP